MEEKKKKKRHRNTRGVPGMKMKIFTGTPSPKISHDRTSQRMKRGDSKEADPSQISEATSRGKAPEH